MKWKLELYEPTQTYDGFPKWYDYELESIKHIDKMETILYDSDGNIIDKKVVTQAELLNKLNKERGANDQNIQISNPCYNKIKEDLISSIIPIGIIHLDVTGKMNKNYWMRCQGQELDRVIFKELFNVIGTKYGDGDGSTTFNVLDLRPEHWYIRYAN